MSSKNGLHGYQCYCSHMTTRKKRQKHIIVVTLSNSDSEHGYLPKASILITTGEGGSPYDVTSCLDAWSHVPSRGSLSLVPCSFCWGLCLGRSLTETPTTESPLNRDSPKTETPPKRPPLGQRSPRERPPVRYGWAVRILLE